jgi:hypothetical protein
VIKVEYKGEEITFVEHLDKWAWKGELNPSLTALKKKIDKSQKVEFDRVEVYVKAYNSIYPATATSKTEDGLFWVVRADDGKREKVADIRAKTEENDRLYQRYLGIGEEINRLVVERKQVIDSMEPFALKEAA